MTILSSPQQPDAVRRAESSGYGRLCDAPSKGGGRGKLLLPGGETCEKNFTVEDVLLGKRRRREERSWKGG